jgi:DNA mismatch endonuclease (patch repair protein)
MMRRFRKAETGPELRLREALGQLGLQFEVYPDLFGSPDLLLPASRTAVFVQGCFWHGCPSHYRQPRTRRVYWAEKLARTRRRDRAAARRLRGEGYRVFFLWECAIKRDAVGVSRRLLRVAEGRLVGAQPL